IGSLSPESPYHLFVKFDRRGAAVRRVVLNKFKSSDRLGHPVEEPLELIPYQQDLPEYSFGSNVLYHYDINRPEAQRPLDTLGKIVWDVDKPRKVEKTESVDEHE